MSSPSPPSRMPPIFTLLLSVMVSLPSFPRMTMPTMFATG